MELPEEVKIFLVESYELVDSVESSLLALEQNPTDAAHINLVFRGVHTIKGNCGFLALRSIESLCHAGEELLDSIRGGRTAFTVEIGSILLELVDALRVGLGELERTGNDNGLSVSALPEKLRNLI